MSKISRSAYVKMITEDVAWLRKQPDTLERDHIEQVLFWSIDALYLESGVSNEEFPR